MKLVEILARDLSEWPKNFVAITQDDGCAIYGWISEGAEFRDGGWYSPEDDDCGMTDLDISDPEQASDYKKSIVTRDQWQAERDRQKGGEWKRHRGGWMPVGLAGKVEVKLRCGDIQQADSHQFAWRHDDCDHAANIMQYRIISQPQAEEVDVRLFNHEVSMDSQQGEIIHGPVKMGDTVIAPAHPKWEGTNAVTDFSVGQWHQIDGPIKWRDTIIHCQAIIEDCEREIQRNVDLLDAEGLMMQTDSKKAMQHYAPDVDMSDWRNWKAGDIVECVTSEYEGTYDNGKQYVVECVNDEMFSVYDNYGGASSCDWFDHDAEGLKFIRRP